MENRIVSILINLDGDIIVTYADGTTQNLGPADGLDPESILAQCIAAQEAAAEAAAAAAAAVESIPADYSQLASDVEDLKTDVTGIETALESKADADDLDVLSADITDLSNTKADKTGVYDYLTAGLANQLATDQGATDSVPYLIRPSGGGVAVGSYEQDKIVGGSVVWNQLVDTNTQSVTVSSGHKIYAVISGTASVFASDGTAVAVTGGTDKLIDLTAMFGATVADYIHSLETATSGACVAWLKKHFPKQFDSGYQDYNAAEIKSLSGLVSHNMTGFNQWDEEWELGLYDTTTGEKTSGTQICCKNPIPVAPNTQYYFNTAGFNNRILFYDAKNNYTGSNRVANNSIFTTPDNAYFMTFHAGSSYGRTYKHDICINFSDPAKNGTYKPYELHSYPLDSELVLRGIPKLDVNNQLYYDGDSYNPDGIVERRYAERAYQSGDESLIDALTDGTVTVYKLTTPTTETATPYQTPQLVNPDGTEEYILSASAFPMPVGHETLYPENLKEKLEGLPWNFSNIIAPTESGYTAGRPYTSGDLFIVDNILYKATASIASGATITPGTNCTATTVAAEIKALQ